MSEERALKLYEESARCLSRADLYSSKRRRQTAEAALHRALALLAQTRKPNSFAPLRVQVLRGLGDFYRGEAKYQKGKACLLESLRISERFLGRDHIETALVLNSLGVLGKYSGDYTHAKRSYDRALRISRRHGDRWLVATIYHNLGGLFHERHRYTQAESYARRSIRLRETLLGKNHNEVMADWAAYAAILQGQCRYRRALSIYEKVLKYFERRGEVYEIAVNEHNLGVLSYSLKEPERARKHLARSLSLKQNVLGTRHPDYAFTLCSFGILHLRLGEKEAAKKMLSEALTVFLKHLGRKHAYVTLCRKHLLRLKKV